MSAVPNVSPSSTGIHWLFRSREDDGKAGEAAEHEPVAVAPGQFGPGHGQTKAREPAQEPPKGDACLQGEPVGPQAKVDAVAEPKVWARRPAQVEDVGVGPVAGVAVGRS